MSTAAYTRHRSETDIQIHAIDPPLPSAQETPQPLDAQTGPLGLASRQLIRGSPSESTSRGVQHLGGGGVETVDSRVRGIVRVVVGRGGTRRKPVAAEVEEAAVGPVARGHEEDEEQHRAVHARPVEEVCTNKEEEDESGRGVGRDEKEREPAVSRRLALRCRVGRNVVATHLRRQNMAAAASASNCLEYERSGVCSLGEQTASKGNRARRRCEVRPSDVVAFGLRAGAKRADGGWNGKWTSKRTGGQKQGAFDSPAWSRVRRYGEWSLRRRHGGEQKTKCVGRVRMRRG